MQKEFVFKFDTPVLIICFNRPQYIKKQIEALRQIEPPVVYISRDGAREGNDEDQKKVEIVKKLYLEGIDWNCRIITRFMKQNHGCFDGPLGAMHWFFNHEKEGIILEDDIIPGIDFFRFAQEMLEKYRDNKKIISISGCNFGYHGEPNEYLFCKIMNMWGWATWADRFNQVDFSMPGWNPEKSNYFFLYRKLKSKLFDFDFKWWIHLGKYFNRTKNRELITWDYQFIYFQLLNNKLSIFPARNLILNLGFEEDATHTKQLNHPLLNLEIEKLKFPLLKNIEVNNNTFFYENYLKKVWSNYNRPNWKYYIGKILGQ